MKILLLGYHDDANVASDLSRALNSVGHEAQAYSGIPHPLLYPHCARRLLTIDRDFALSADVVDYYASNALEGFHFPNKPTIVQHGGSFYRRNAKVFNDYWNPRVRATVIRTGDLWRLGSKTAKNPIYLIPPVDTDFLQPRKRTGKIVVGHFPSNPKTKGTEAILSCLASLPASKRARLDVRTSDKVTPWPEHIKQVAACDVIIEAMQPTINNNPFGEPGVASREAASLGCGVITHHAYKAIYETAYGLDCPHLIANDLATLDTQLRKVASMSRKRLREWQEESRTWVVAKHSYAVTANRYINEVYQPCLSS